MSSRSVETEIGSAQRDHAERVRACIESDLEALWKAVSFLLVRSAAGRTRRAEIARRVEDVVNETVVRALGHPGNYDLNRPVLPWLVGIARNVLKEEWREVNRGRRDVAQTDLGDEAWTRLLEGLAGEASGPIEADRKDELNRILERLTPEERQAVKCRYLQQLTGEPLARALGAATPSAAHVRVFRALQKLKQRSGQAESEVTS